MKHAVLFVWVYYICVCAYVHGQCTIVAKFLCGGGDTGHQQLLLQRERKLIGQLLQNCIELHQRRLRLKRIFAIFRFTLQ